MMFWPDHDVTEETDEAEYQQRLAVFRGTIPR